MLPLLVALHTAGAPVIDGKLAQRILFLPLDREGCRVMSGAGLLVTRKLGFGT